MAWWLPSTYCRLKVKSPHLLGCDGSMARGSCPSVVSYHHTFPDVLLRRHSQCPGKRVRPEAPIHSPGEAAEDVSPHDACGASPGDVSGNTCYPHACLPEPPPLRPDLSVHLSWTKFAHGFGDLICGKSRPTGVSTSSCDRRVSLQLRNYSCE